MNVIRVYTVLGPDFYRAIVGYNQGVPPSQWIWFYQGIWTPDIELEGYNGEGADANEPTITAIMRDFVDRTVRVVHGDGAVRYLATGTGNYVADASPWCLAWVLGTEWYPFTVNATNSGVGAGQPHFTGTYITTTPDANPMESWIAGNMEFLLQRDMDFGWQRPVAFTNWITTDPLSHPLEPDEPWSSEDWMSVNGTRHRVRGQDRHSGGAGEGRGRGQTHADPST